MNVVVGASLVSALLSTMLAVLIWKLLASTRIRGVDPDWLRNFSIAAYRPMERLLSENDIRFLKSQSGYEPELDQRLRTQRRQVFRAYLRNLGRDFNRLHLALRLMALHAPEDNPELAKMLIKQKMMFFIGFLAVHFRLSLYGLGIGSVDVRFLVDTLDTMRAELQGLMAPA